MKYRIGDILYDSSHSYVLRVRVYIWYTKTYVIEIYNGKGLEEVVELEEYYLDNNTSVKYIGDNHNELLKELWGISD